MIGRQWMVVNQMQNADMDTRAHIIVSGIVQGVGYRFFVQRYARKMNLSGWVRNLPTREVEILVEGPRGLIESLTRELYTGNLHATVRNVQVHWETFEGKYRGFDIRV